MKSSAFNNVLVSVESAWLCAAETDVQREEEERDEARIKLGRQSVKDKYELASAATRLDQELKAQHLEWRKKADLRRQCHIPRGQRELDQPSSATSNNKNKPGSVYALENLRLSTLMGDAGLRQRAKRKKRRPRIVHDMLSLERRYATSARRLQKWWREHLHRQFWWLYFRQVKAVVQIQRVARGFLTRRWVQIWHANRTLRVTRLQALFRGYYIRQRVLVTWKRWEYLNAAKIQSIVRMYFGRRCRLRCQQEIAALHIQSLWRGYTSRQQSDIRWLAAKAIELQRLVKGSLARRKTRKRAARFQHAATQIQRMFRGMKTRTEIVVLLRDRETHNRQEFMALLEAEEEWHRTQRDKLEARLHRLQLRQRVCQLEEELFRKHERIHDMESVYLDMQTQRMRVSPRAIEHGWVEEMEDKMKKQRALITQLKLESVFELGLEFKTKECELLQFHQRIHQLEEKRRRFEIWRDEEFLDYWERDCRSRHQAKLIQRRQHIAETRRRWGIQFFRHNGKRDNRWRGTFWTQQVLDEAREKEVFCIGSTDTLALIQDKWRQRTEGAEDRGRVKDDAEKERDTREHISDLTNQVALVAATAQIEQTKGLFDPIFQEIERSFDQVQRQQRAHEKRLAATRIERERLRLHAVHDVAGDRDEHPAMVIPMDPERAMDRQQRKRQLMQAAKVPWHLLDQIAAERHNLAQEKAMFKLWGTIPTAESL